MIIIDLLGNEETVTSDQQQDHLTLKSELDKNLQSQLELELLIASIDF
jgi:hypothetical protein